MKPKFFSSQAKFRQWLQENHDSCSELWVGFHKVHTGKPSITWPQSVDEALCFGWIDGLRRGLDADTYMIRFSPRRAESFWSNVNTRRFAELEKLGLVRAAGRDAFAKRDAARSTAFYSFQADNVVFDAATERLFRKNPSAWKFFTAQPPGYRKMATHWVTSAKREETRAKRLAELVKDSAEGRRLERFTKYAKSKR